MELILIGDKRIENVPVVENGEALVDLAVEFPELQFDLTRKHVQKISSNITFARREIGLKLKTAQESLPLKYRFLIKECFRPLNVQKQFWDNYFSFLQKKNPDWNNDRLNLECSKYIAPLSVAPHSTGGAVDLLLIDHNGDWLDMGCQFNAEPSDCEYRTYFYSDKTSQEARANREILRDALVSIGRI